MKALVQCEYRLDKKEKLGAAVRRVANAFESSGVEFSVRASFSDSPTQDGVSAVARALKKHPTAGVFERTDALMPGLPSGLRLSNLSGDLEFPFELVLALSDGVPRSLPFDNVQIVFEAPGFSGSEHSGGLPPGITGVTIRDSWWVNGRKRALNAGYIVDADQDSKDLPPPPTEVAAVLEQFGKPRKTTQHVLPDSVQEEPPPAAPDESAPPPEAARLSAIVGRYRAGMADLIERVGQPHALPPLEAALRAPAGKGPLKPDLTKAFRPRGYDCRGGGGTFTLRRRTETNLVVDFVVDVGTWSRMVTAMFTVRGPAFKATLPVPISGALQYPIGDSERWTLIVENLAVVVDELERIFVPEIEAVADPAPEWFDPDR